MKRILIGHRGVGKSSLLQRLTIYQNLDDKYPNASVPPTLMLAIASSTPEPILKGIVPGLSSGMA